MHRSEPAPWFELAPSLPRLRAYALALSGSRDAADDLFQTAIEQALHRVQAQNHARQTEDSVCGLMLTIQQCARQSERRRHLAERRADRDVLVDGRQVVEAREDLRVAEDRISRLPHEQRQVLDLVVRDGKSYRETADTLGIAIGTVMSRLARARAAIMGPVSPA